MPSEQFMLQGMILYRWSNHYTEKFRVLDDISQQKINMVPNITVDMHHIL